jgi:hypothetical protein
MKLKPNTQLSDHKRILLLNGLIYDKMTQKLYYIAYKFLKLERQGGIILSNGRLKKERQREGFNFLSYNQS